MVKESAGRRRKQARSVAPSKAQIQKLVEVISRSQHDYRDLIDNLDLAVFTLSLDGEIRVANRCMSEILGVSFQNLIGHRLDEFVESPVLDQARQDLVAFEQKGLWSGTVPLRLKKDKGGDSRHFSCWLQAVVEEGRMASVSGWARDVTSQSNSEVRFREVFDSLHEGIFLAAPGGEIIDVNPAFLRLLGYQNEREVKALNFQDIYADPSRRADILRELEEKGSVQNKELVLRRKDGTHVHCLASGFAVRDAAGRLIRRQGMLVDITERRAIEQRLHHEEEFVRRLVASFPDPIIVLNTEGKFTFVSQRIQEILGISPEEFTGTHFGKREHPEDGAMIEQFMQALRSGRTSTAQLEFRCRHADGSWKLLRASGAPLFDESGKISGIVCSVRDTTESKRLEQQLAQKEKFASMGQMMAGAAHELNNPLTAILGISDLLHEGAIDNVTRRQADLILQQARRAAGIVQNLLAFSRPPSQGWSKIGLVELCWEALRFERDTLDQKDIDVRFTAADDLPPVEGDYKLLTQVFLNLLANSEQSISAAGGHGIIDISFALANNNIRLTVADNGPGVSPENATKIFDPFFTTKRPGGGSGLGLTISLAIIKEHGGTIELQSTPGSGATFNIFLPAAMKEIEAGPRVFSSPKAGTAGFEALQGHAVLIVDDEESIREIMQEGLMARGMRVESAGSSEAALAYLAKNTCEIILCDFNLPGLRGDLFFEMLHARFGSAAPRFVFMTGELVDPALVERFREKGACVLQKPFSVSALAALLTVLFQPQLS